eukprot:XP_017951585.1 PREDICTED: lysosomal thioesterase PPT2 isoform X1 [Xenopus tropicalis]
MTSPSPKALPTFYLLLPLLVWMVGHSLCYKPVIVIHGLFDSSANFKNLLQYINESHPGTNVTVLDLFDNKESLQPLWKQVQGFKEAIYPIMQNAGRDGVHLLCYSQDTDYLRYLFPKYVKSNLYRLCYTQLGQTFSICNFWNDPHHHGIYVNVSDFLAPLNSERPEPNATDWKKNFLRLRKMVLIGGPDDGVITPWESSHFGFYDENETVLEMKYQMVYQDDTFGLRSMDYRGAVSVYSVPGVAHTMWHSNQTVFNNCIEKWLT